jgi:hypothetical protein
MFKFFIITRSSANIRNHIYLHYVCTNIVQFIQTTDFQSLLTEISVRLQIIRFKTLQGSIELHYMVP